jgi:capsular exopolysaccharide synthesis family protein
MQEFANILERRPPTLSLPPLEAVDVNKEKTLGDLWKVLRRRKFIVLSSLCAVLAVSALLFATAPRLYKASAQIQLQRETSDALALNNMIGQETGGDTLESNMTLQTQARILQSDSMALGVIETLKLEKSPDFVSRFSPIGWVMGLMAPKGQSDPKDAPLSKSPGRRASVIRAFQSRLKVSPIAGTHLISIEYYSTNPKTAADVVNTLLQNLIDYNFTTRHEATQRASGWLSDQLADLRKQSEQLNDKLVQLQHNSGMFSLGQVDTQGRDQVYTPAVARLQQVTADLGEAQSSRIMKGALYQIVKTGNPELISGLAGTGFATANAGVAGSLNLLQNLRTQEAQTQAQLNSLSEKFGPSYPKLAELQASLDTTRNQIEAEVGRVAARVKNDYIVAQKVESDDRAVQQQTRQQAEQVNDKAVEYEIVRQDAQQSSELYQSMVKRMKEADLVSGLHSSNITIVDSAFPQSRPAKPALPLYAVAGVFGGLVVGLCLAVIRDSVDNRIVDIANLELGSVPAPIAMLPMHKAKRGQRRLGASRRNSTAFNLTVDDGSGSIQPRAVVAASDPRSAYTESLRALCTWLLQEQGGAPAPQLVVVTSSIPGEGKSMVSLNLAAVFAQRRKRVLLVDGDLRTPQLHSRIGISNERGLADILNGEGNSTAFETHCVRIDNFFQFDVIVAGAPPAYPTELLSSNAMLEQIAQWRSEYDYIIVDGAPILPVNDSVVLSRYADYTLLVARHNVTDRRSLDRTFHILQSQGIHNMGVVLNGVRLSGPQHLHYYGYNNSTYYGDKAHA